MRIAGSTALTLLCATLVRAAEFDHTHVALDRVLKARSPELRYTHYDWSLNSPRKP